MSVGLCSDNIISSIFLFIKIRLFSTDGDSSEEKTTLLTINISARQSLLSDLFSFLFQNSKWILGESVGIN